MNDIVFIAGPGIKEVYALATDKMGTMPTELRELSAAVAIGMDMPAGVRLVLGETAQDIVTASDGLPASDKFEVQIQYIFLRMLRGEDGKLWADSFFNLFRSNLEKAGILSARNFKARFVEHTRDNPINPVMKFVVSFETERKQVIFGFVEAIENAHKQDPNYSLKLRLTKEIELQQLREKEEKKKTEHKAVAQPQSQPKASPAAVPSAPSSKKKSFWQSFFGQ